VLKIIKQICNNYGTYAGIADRMPTLVTDHYNIVGIREVTLYVLNPLGAFYYNVHVHTNI